MTTLEKVEYPIRMLRLGLDVDGVLANFVSGFLAALAHVTGRPVPPDYVQRTWSTWHDYRKSEIDAAWDVTHAPFWWQRLDPLDHPDMTVRQFLAPLWMYRHRIETTFITSRPSVTARQQTVAWLQRQGMIDPQVIVSSNKGVIATILELDVLVDDYTKNLQHVVQHSPQTRAVLFRQPWNVGLCGTPVHEHCVDGLPALWQAIEGWAGLPSFTVDRSTAGR